jgi:reactive intermediate/imine deaminase
VRGDGIIWTSGQVPVDLRTGQVVEGGIEAQTRQTLENVRAALALAGASLADVVKVNIFLTDMGDFAAMNGVYREFFPSEPPARTTVGTTALANPAMRIEIEAVALAPEAG